MNLHRAQLEDHVRLGDMNHRLICDEGHSNPMSPFELRKRMAQWLDGDYTAVLFEVAEETVGYALYRPDVAGIYLRQFYIEAAHRRQGRGREAMRMLREQFWPQGTVVTLEVLSHNNAAIDFWRAVGCVEYAVTFKLS